ncbi:MAG: hypothetical protein QOF36_2171 [Microbacteriaceae bacterium]|nr:hypothetical protein [Microbacteriaceae bacterium]
MDNFPPMLEQPAVAPVEQPVVGLTEQPVVGLTEPPPRMTIDPGSLDDQVHATHDDQDDREQHQ